jgi:hypothetical protein
MSEINFVKANETLGIFKLTIEAVMQCTINIRRCEKEPHIAINICIRSQKCPVASQDDGTEAVTHGKEKFQ